MNRNNCIYSATGKFSCMEKFAQQQETTEQVKIQDTYYDGIPQNKRIQSTKLMYAFCVRNQDNKFVIHECYKINELKIKVLEIERGAHNGKDIIHFDIVPNEILLKDAIPSYRQLTIKNINC